MLERLAASVVRTASVSVAEAIRMISEEIEYSEENLDYLWDILQDDTPLFPVDGLS